MATDYTQEASCVWAFLCNATNMTDESSNSVAITVGGGITTTAGKYGNALVFDSASDALITFDAAADPPHAGTMVGWFTFVGATRDRPIGSHDNFETRFEGTSNLTIYNDFFSASPISIAGLSLATRYHVAFTWNLTTGRLETYIDGSLEVSSDTGADTDPGNGLNLTLGTRTGSTDYFAGTMDEIALFSEVLTSKKINELMDNGL